MACAMLIEVIAPLVCSGVIMKRKNKKQNI
jgi:hypothetical protein